MVYKSSAITDDNKFCSFAENILLNLNLIPFLKKMVSDIFRFIIPSVFLVFLLKTEIIK